MPLHCCSESCTQGMLRFYCHKITWKIRFLAPSHAKDSNYTGRGHAGTVGSSGSIQGEGISSALLHVPTLTWCDTSHPGSLLHKQHTVLSLRDALQGWGQAPGCSTVVAMHKALSCPEDFPRLQPKTHLRAKDTDCLPPPPLFRSLL